DCQQDSFSVHLTQSVESSHGFNGPKLTGDFSTPCEGQFSLQLYLNRNHVIGNIAGKGHVDGTVSGSSMEFAIISGQGGLENGQVIVAEGAMSRWDGAEGPLYRGREAGVGHGVDGQGPSHGSRPGRGGRRERAR